MPSFPATARTLRSTHVDRQGPGAGRYHHAPPDLLVAGGVHLDVMDVAFRGIRGDGVGVA
jgi:hypothetical protein